MNKPNLSFINDKEWIAERNRYWKVIEVNLKSDFRSKDLKCINHYYMTGKQIEGYRLSDGALLQYYPLANAEGWDFVLENLVEMSSIFEHDFYYSVYGNYIGFGTLEEKLRYFDYYHPNSFQSVVKSNVPVGQNKDEVELIIDKLKIFHFIASSLIRFIDKNQSSICFYRSTYFYSLLCFLDTQDMKQGGDPHYFLSRMMRLACNYKPKVENNDPKKVQYFLSDFSEKLDTLELDTSVKKLWQEIKQEQGVA